MTSLPHGSAQIDSLTPTANTLTTVRQTFGRLYPANPLDLGELSHELFVGCLQDLADSMKAEQYEDGPADAGMTFFAQFLDHDITRDASSVMGSRVDPTKIANVRTPALDLDCVYGDGPSASSHLYGAGKASEFLIYGRRANRHDFGRTSVGTALIGDPRNDENIILAQLHGAFICLHNILMTKLLESDRDSAEIRDIGRAGIDKSKWHNLTPPALKNFQEIRRFIRLHYQWIVWNELLPAFVDQEAMTAASGGLNTDDVPVMPIEFSGAAFRFGHATVQPQYRLRPGESPRGLFQTRGFGPRPVGTDLDFSEFFSMTHGTAQKARPVGPKIADPLFALPFVTGPEPLGETGLILTTEQARKLPLRNLLRDRYTYELASGQMVAEALRLEPLAPPPVLHDTGLTRTPLWYYCLQEAEAHGRGRLCGVGGRIVASVFYNLLERDPGTYRHVSGFTPWSGFAGQPTVLAGLLNFVETYRDNIVFANELCCS